MRVADVMSIIDAVAPFGAAEPWDKVGLALGDATASVEAIYVALDPTLEAIGRTSEHGATVLVSHHPLMLEAPPRLVAGDPTADRVLAAARAGIAVVAAHTNADLVPELATEAACEAFGITEPKPLIPSTGLKRFKLVVFVPPAAQDGVASALAEAGAGVIGDYVECTFSSPGVGTFRPMEGASPAVGEIGRLERVDEVRLETVVPAPRLGAAIAAMIDAHPYEEVAYDVYPLEGPSVGGFGCQGALAEPLALDDVSERCRVLFGADPWLPVGRVASAASVRRMAVMPGSASAAAAAAIAAQADVLVCGEMKYHEALDAAEKGVTVLAVGHGASEMPIVRGLADALRRGIAERGWGIPVVMEGP